ncbi:MAG: cellulose binding domain-containing protein [Trebonia sp.]
MNYDPDPDDLFVRPSAAGPPPRSPRHRARGRFRLTGGSLLGVAALAVLAVAALVGGAVLTGFPGGGGARALPPKSPDLASPTGPAGISPSPSPVSSSSPSAPANGTGKAPTAISAEGSLKPPPATASAVMAAAASGQAAVTVTYAVDSRSEDGFQAEVDVSNNGSSSLSGWHIVVALPQDEVTSVQGATGSVSHHVLLLSPASSSSVIAPGTMIRVSFTAEGFETTPELCLFNTTTCG